MTDKLDKLARDIAEEVIRDEPENPGLVAIVRLAVSKGAKKGIEAGMKLQRERDAVIADNRAKASKTAIDCMPDEDKSYLRGSLIASEQIAGAIRTQP